jgi:hypothetical protein
MFASIQNKYIKLSFNKQLFLSACPLWCSYLGAAAAYVVSRNRFYSRPSKLFGSDAAIFVDFWRRKLLYLCGMYSQIQALLFLVLRLRLRRIVAACVNRRGNCNAIIR